MSRRDSRKLQRRRKQSWASTPRAGSAPRPLPRAAAGGGLQPGSGPGAPAQVAAAQVAAAGAAGGAVGAAWAAAWAAAQRSWQQNSGPLFTYVSSPHRHQDILSVHLHSDHLHYADVGSTHGVAAMSLSSWVYNPRYDIHHVSPKIPSFIEDDASWESRMTYTNPDYVLRHVSCMSPVDERNARRLYLCRSCNAEVHDGNVYLGFVRPQTPRDSAYNREEMRRQQQWSMLLTQLTENVMREAGLGAPDYFGIDDGRPWNWALVLTWSLYRVFAYVHGEKTSRDVGDDTPYWDYMTVYLDMWSEAR